LTCLAGDGGTGRARLQRTRPHSLPGSRTRTAQGPLAAWLPLAVRILRAVHGARRAKGPGRGQGDRPVEDDRILPRAEPGSAPWLVELV
jgi:hypothetical protein